MKQRNLMPGWNVGLATSVAASRVLQGAPLPPRSASDPLRRVITASDKKTVSKAEAKRQRRAARNKLHNI